MVVVVDQFGYEEFCSWMTLEYFTSSDGISTRFAWAAPSALDKVVFVGDGVDSGEHGDGCIIHPYNGEYLIVDYHSREFVPLHLHRLAHFEGFRVIG